MRTLIEATWVVAHDGTAQVVVTDADCVVDGERVAYLGDRYDGPRPDHVISGTNLLVTPGLISTHLHAGTNALDETFLDPGRRDAHGRNYLNWVAGVADAARYAPDGRISSGFGLARVLLSGVTTVMEIGAGGGAADAFLDAAEEIGIRVYTGLSFQETAIYSRPDGSFAYDDDPGRGRALFDRALSFAERVEARSNPRLQPILCPGHPDTCSPDLLRAVAAHAGPLPVTIHAAINPDEMRRCLDRYRLTSIELLDHVGLLRPRTMLAHAVFLSGHSAARVGGTTDLDLIATSGAAVSHSPAKYLASGFLLESWERYRARGVPMTIGTDATPTDIVGEMRAATVGARLADRDFRCGRPADVLTAATVTAADWLGRPELGRLMVGGPADLAVFDLDDFRFGTVVDPIRSLLDYGHGNRCRHVFVAGQHVVSDGRLTQMDHAELLRKGREESARQLDDIPNWAWAGRSAGEMGPASFGSRPAAEWR